MSETVPEGWWASFARSSWGQWDMLEASVAGGSFAVFIVFFRLLDQCPRMHPSRFRKDEDKPMPLFQPDPNHSWRPLIVYLLAIRVYHCILPKKAPDEVPPSVLRVVVEVLLGVFLYDFIFYWIHYAMHEFPSLAALRHSEHHNQVTLCASEVQHHSVVDATLQVSVNILVQQVRTPFGPKHYLSRLLHNIIITYMLTEIHAGYDCWWSLHRLCPTIIGGARRHEIHHKNGSLGNYQQFFMYLDDIMGTSVDDKKSS